MFLVNHVHKFKRLTKSMSYAKADCCHLNRNVKGLKESSGTQCGQFLGKNSE